MSRSYYQGKLKGILETAADEGFLQLIWATNAIQSDRAAAGMKHLQPESVPDAAVTEEISSRLALHQWELETLSNELLTAPKRASIKNGQERTLNTTNFQNIVRAVRYLRKLENTEYGSGPKSDSIYMEMARIANRQFDWQRGYFNPPQFYRNAFIYGQGICSQHFERTHGITINELSLIGFAIFVSLTEKPAFVNNFNMRDMGVSPDKLRQALSIISQPIEIARQVAHDERRGKFHTAYRPSIFRMKPCVAFENGRILAPLPELVLERVTSGIFYDIISGGGPVRNDYGKRFENYCLDYLRLTMPEFDWLPETKYRVKPNSYDTPDILCTSQGVLKFAIECKSSRMSYDARFGKDPFEEFEDIIKGTFQLWRFFSHSRRGLTGYKIDDNAVGVVLTLENWLTMANPLRDKVIAAAEKMAAEKDPLIVEVDRRPTSFVAITDLEQTLRYAEGPKLLDAIKSSATKHTCWHLDSVYKELNGTGSIRREYPFSSRIAEVLPWWDMMKETKTAALLPP